MNVRATDDRNQSIISYYKTWLREAQRHPTRIEFTYRSYESTQTEGR